MMNIDLYDISVDANDETPDPDTSDSGAIELEILEVCMYFYTAYNRFFLHLVLFDFCECFFVKVVGIVIGGLGVGAALVGVIWGIVRAKKRSRDFDLIND